MIIGRLHSIPNWETASTSSVESDDIPSLTDAEWDNLGDRHCKLNPLWPENISDSLPSELQPFLLSHPVRPQHVQDNQTYLTLLRRDDKRAHSIREESPLLGDETNHSMSEESSLYGDETNHSMNEESSLFGGETNHSVSEESSLFWDEKDRSEESSLFGDEKDRSEESSLFGDDETDNTMSEKSSLFGDSDETDHSTFQMPSNVKLQHPGVQPKARKPSKVKFQPLPGPHYDWMQSNLRAGRPITSPPSNLTYPSAINTALPPKAQSVNASTVLPPSASSSSTSRYLAYIPRTKK
ncbi:hypothetical protein BDR05DRAFT_179449 [Suillus weaverae]|nr:hypothetical protein BDR05DRAFT_179449 [Suillus weaverae]